MKKLSFQKVYNEKVHFQKAECLASTYKSGNLRGKLPKKIMYKIGRASCRERVCSTV